MKVGENMVATKARIKANAKYNAKTYEQIILRVKKGEKATLQAIAAEQGMSVNSFITTAIDYYLSNKCPNTRDNLTPDAETAPDPTLQEDR